MRRFQIGVRDPGPDFTFISHHLRPVAASPCYPVTGSPSRPVSCCCIKKEKAAALPSHPKQNESALVTYSSYCRQPIHRVELARAGALIVKIALHFPVSKIKRSLRPTIHTDTVRLALM